MVEPIYFDARYIRTDHHDGISRFSAGLCAALAQLHPVVAIVYDAKQLDYLPKNIRHVFLHSPTSWREPFSALSLNRLGAKMVFSPMQTIGTLGRKFKLVLTLHDLIYYKHPTPPPSMPWFVRVMWRLYHLSYTPQRIALNGADAVATVSQTTKGLIATHRLTKRPVGVVYNAVEQSLDAAVPFGKRNNQLVYMGSFMGYKGVETLIEAMALLPKYQLHLLSKITAARESQLTLLAQQYGANVVFHHGVSEAEYQQILSHAFALVSASKDEGFGIPLIEAMQVETPVVVSDIPIFHEIGEDAATYFADAKQLAAEISKLQDAVTWKQQAALGLARAENFSWENSAKALLALFAQVKAQ